MDEQQISEIMEKLEFCRNNIHRLNPTEIENLYKTLKFVENVDNAIGHG